MLVSTEEEKLVLEKSVRHSSKMRVFIKNLCLNWTGIRRDLPKMHNLPFFWYYRCQRSVCPYIYFVIATKHHANLYFNFLIGWGGEERGFFFFFICLYLIYGFTLDTGECCWANFKYYLILQTRLLMLARSEACFRAVAKWRWEWMHMRMSLIFQSSSKTTFRLGQAHLSQKAKIIGSA